DYADLFGDQHELFPPEIEMKPNYVAIEDFTKVKKLQDEKDLLQMYVTRHPLQEYRNRLKRSGYTAVSKVAELPENKTVQMMTLLQSMRKNTRKRRDSMVILNIEDDTGDLDAVFFPQQFREESSILENESYIALKGKVSI